MPEDRGSVATPRLFGMLVLLAAGFIARYADLRISNALIGLVVVWLAIEVVREYRRSLV
jgi:hypothetical protein